MRSVEIGRGERKRERDRELANFPGRSYLRGEEGGRVCYAPRTIREAEELGDMLRSSREIWKFVTLSVDVSRRRSESFSVKHIYIIEYVEKYERFSEEDRFCSRIKKFSSIEPPREKWRGMMMKLYDKKRDIN